MSAFEFVRSWLTNPNMKKAADQIRQTLLIQLVQSGRPGAGVEMKRSAKNFMLAKYIVHQFQDMEATLQADSIVIALKKDMDAVTSDPLRKNLADAGLMGEEAMNLAAEATAKAEELGLSITPVKSAPIPDGDYKDENWDPESPAEKAKVEAAQAKAAAAAKAGQEKYAEDKRVAELVVEAANAQKKVS